MEEWKEYKLGEIIKVLDFKRIPLSSQERSMRKGYFPYYGAQGIIDYVDDYIFDGTYLLIAEDGENLKSNKQNIAQIARGKFWVNNHAHIVDSNGLCDIRYLCYLLNNIDISGYITGSAQPKLNQANLLSIVVKLPFLNTQQSIANYIAIFDEKIELNRRINDNLEQQAQALFKAWFVDFEPFKDGKFVDSELGKIPEGWKVVHADEVFDINIGKTPPRKESIWFSNSGSSNVQWVSISDMGNCGAFIGNSKEHLTQDAINKFNIIIVPKDTILLSFKLTIGRVAIAQKELTTNEAIARFYLPYSQYREFTYLTLKNYDYSKLGSTSSIATAVNSKIIKGMKILLPINEHIKNFSTIVKPIFDLMESYSNEIDSLSQLRDTLLPRLMSGELKITDIVDKSLNE